MNKYPSVANAAKDVVHWCKIVADCEKTHDEELVKIKKELHEKFNLFIKTCDDYINGLV
jgi:hypothetical protein